MLLLLSEYNRLLLRDEVCEPLEEIKANAGASSCHKNTYGVERTYGQPWLCM